MPQADLAESLLKTLVHGGQTRQYCVYFPSTLDRARPTPLVFFLHGNGGTTEGVEKDLTRRGFDRLAERDRFLVVYPQGFRGHWNANPSSTKQGLDRTPDLDDVGFFEAMIEALGKEVTLDRRRIYATGISNGGFMCFRLAGELANRLAGVAPVAANLSQKLIEHHTPTTPISMCIINGTQDPLVPYEGGDIRLPGGKASGLGSLSTAATIEFWVKLNGCEKEPVVSLLPDLDATDETRVRRSLYRRGKAGTEVVLYAVEGGGHTWPGGPGYLPALFGRVCRDFDANEAIWEFFKAHPKR